MANTPLMSPRDMLDIIFAQRNQAYGAYLLRRNYTGNLGRAFGLSLLLIALLLILPRVLSALSAGLNLAAPEDREYRFSPPPLILTPPSLLVPPVETPLPPQRTTARFVPPDVRPDEEMPKESALAAQHDLLDQDGDIDKLNRTGNPDAAPNDLAPGLNDGVGILETPAPPPNDDIHTITDVQKMPAFPGGEAELMKFLAQNTRYPTLAQENGIQGTVALSFVVGKDGAISDITILKDPGGGCGKEAVRVLQSMPRWSPGEANGHAVRVRFTLPVRFRLQ